MREANTKHPEAAETASELCDKCDDVDNRTKARKEERDGLITN